MRLDFFSDLDPEEARQYLRRYRELEARGWEETAAQLRPEGLVADFRVGSLAAAVKLVIPRLQVVRLPEDPTVPAWIRETTTHQKANVTFTEESKVLALRTSWYFGETFAREFEHLEWATGDPEFEAANQPVLRGFEDELELAPIMVTENLVMRVLNGFAGPECVDVAVRFWADSARNAAAGCRRP